MSVESQAEYPVLLGYDPHLMAAIKSTPKPARILLADPIGTGRSYAVASIIRELFGKSSGRFNCLIATPWSRVLAKNWHELLEGFGLPDVKLLDVVDTASHQLSDGGIFIAPPDFLRESRDVLWNTAWSVVILDDPNGWLSESRFEDEYKKLWEEAPNVSVVIALCPRVRQGSWLVTHPVTRIVRRQHEKLSGDVALTSFGDPMAQQPKLESVVDVLRDYFDTAGETTGRAMAKKLGSFIADTGAQHWISDEDPSTKWSRMVKVLSAIGYIFSYIGTEDSEEGLGSAKVRLPSEADLADLFKVHRATVRKAFDELYDLGVLERGQGGSYLKIEPKTFSILPSEPEAPAVTHMEDAMLSWLVDRGLSGNSELMIKALGDARDRLERLVKATNPEGAESLKEPSLEQELQTSLNKYGLESKAPHYHDAIRKSWLSSGLSTPNMSPQDVTVLNQLGVGWPALSEYGHRIGRELMGSLMHAKSDTLQRVVDSVPPRIVALFIDDYQLGGDVCSLRIPVDRETWDIGDISHIPVFQQIVFFNEVNTWLVKLGDSLVALGLATKHLGPAYRGARWDAVFFNLVGKAAEFIKEWLANRGVSLEHSKRFLNQYAMLAKSPVPTLQEFDLAGISRETLLTYLGTALDREIVTKVVEQGPAFLVLDQEEYKRDVARPVLKEMLHTLVDFSE